MMRFPSLASVCRAPRLPHQSSSILPTQSVRPRTLAATSRLESLTRYTSTTSTYNPSSSSSSSSSSSPIASSHSNTPPAPAPAPKQPVDTPITPAYQPGLLELFFPRTASRPERDATQSLVDTLRTTYAPLSDDPKRTYIGYHGDRTDAHAWAVPGQVLPAGWSPIPHVTPARLLGQWKALSKSRLTFLMMLTGMAGYALVPAGLSTGASVATLLSLTAGMGLCSCAANTLNQFLEAPYDAQMQRTRNRPLPARQTNHLSAAAFAGLTSIAGTTMLATLVNPTVALLGAGNIVLYSFVYTPLKRIHIVNTWIGSVVGGIPPLMGWAAATNGSLLALSDLPGWMLATILFAWQFPHFNALSHTLCSDYARGAYRMMSVLNPPLNRRTSMRYALLLVPTCLALPFVGTTPVVVPAFALLSLLPNLALVRTAWRFYRRADNKSARDCFLTSLWHLPAVMLLAMFCKTGLWESTSRSSPVPDTTEARQLETA